MRAGIDIDARISVGTTGADVFTVDATFTAPPGITALVGPSGAGKSVTLSTIAGLLRPSRGRITIDGRVVADAEQGVHVRTQERGIGMVFQQAALLPHRTPLDNVAIAVHPPVDAAGRAGRAGRRHDAAALLERVQAAHLGRAHTRTLSGGEQQRVALARAMAGRPRVLLLDEPFSALDIDTRRSLRSLVRSLVDDGGLTAVLVTHDADDISALADHVVRITPGRAGS